MRRTLVALTLLLAACGDPRPLAGPDGGNVQVGPPTGTTAAQCAAPPLNGLTYSNFGQSFFGSFCTRCHATSVIGIDRNGAPTDHNFDSLAGVQLWRDQIDQVAAMNPTGSQKNTTMPLNAPLPPDPERQKLACWIATELAP
jgi:cytochrome c5